MSAATYAERPLRVYWEVTRACDLACRHCRASAQPDPHPDTLSPLAGLTLIAALARFGAPLPHLVLTGGDPLKRPDLFDLIDAARSVGFQVSLAPSATPLLTAAALWEFRDHGVSAISLSLDGSTAARHDALRGVPGTFERTLAAAGIAADCGLPFQINTLVCEDTVDDLPAILERVLAIGAARWSLFFLVEVGRGTVLRPVSAERAETVLEWIAALGRPQGLVVTTTEAPQLRRLARRPAMHAAGVRDGNGILFISHTGDICPSGFLELPAGNVRTDHVVDVYRRSPLFTALRQPDRFGGRCGQCEFRMECGGSRARALAATGDPLAADPLCAYEPAVRCR
ncbi:MAG: radical SAM protein [Vicinamibacterales bacterium]